jgi:hypothetical protein
MHDLDRALQEFESATAFGANEFAQQGESEGDYEGESYESGISDEGEGEYDVSRVYEAEAEYDNEGSQQFEGARDDHEAVFDEVEEMEAAAALLEVQDEEELDQFLGSLFAKVRKKLGTVLPASVQKALAGTLKKVAGAALPKIGAALGNFVVPGVGGALGAGLAANAGKMFGLELEGMSYEDQEFEVAKRVVNLGVEAAKTAAQSAPAAVNGGAAQTAKDAVLQAASTYAPGLASVAVAPGFAVGPRPRHNGSTGRRRTGRWIRRGNRVILLGI